MTKREKLQAYIDEACEENPDYYHFDVEYRPNDGWWAIAECRYFGDNGEYLGRDYKTALQTLKVLLA